MKPISAKIDSVITTLEAVMLSTDKHVIKADSIKQRVLNSTIIVGVNDDSTYLAGVGLSKMIQSRLWERGYRCVQSGMFVNIDNCDDIDYLNQIVENAETNEETRARAKDRVKALRDACEQLAQTSFILDGNKYIGIKVPPTPEELLEKLEADAV